MRESDWHRAYPAKQRGVGLIEVLITVLVIAIGMLGMAGLLIAGKQATYESVQRTTAAQLMQDMITRMRINSGATQLAAYAPTGGLVVAGGGSARTAQACTSGSTCTQGEVVNYDLYEWERQLLGVGEVADDGNNTGGLVSPTGCITVNTATDPDTYTVAIAWRGVTAGTNPTTNACGSATGLYGTSNEFRRVAFVTFYPGG